MFSIVSPLHGQIVALSRSALSVYCVDPSIDVFCNADSADPCSVAAGLECTIIQESVQLGRPTVDNLHDLLLQQSLPVLTGDPG